MTTAVAWKLRESDELPRKITVGQVFTSEEIQKIKTFAFGLEATVPLVGGTGEHKDIRKCQLKWVRPEEDTAWIYQRLVDVIQKVNNQFFNLNLYGIQTLQYTIYDANDNEFYAPHRDSFEKIINGLVRKLTFSIQLSDPSEYEGGEIEFLNTELTHSETSKVGTIIVFPSFLTYKVKPVKKGKRYLITGSIHGDSFR